MLMYSERLGVGAAGWLVVGALLKNLGKAVIVAENNTREKPIVSIK